MTNTIKRQPKAKLNRRTEKKKAFSLKNIYFPFYKVSIVLVPNIQHKSQKKNQISFFGQR